MLRGDFKNGKFNLKKVVAQSICKSVSLPVFFKDDRLDEPKLGKTFRRPFYHAFNNRSFKVSKPISHNKNCTEE